MALLFQISTTGVCHSKAILILLFSITFWGVCGYGLFNWSKNGHLNGHLKGTEIVSLGLLTLILNQVIIRYGVEGTMQALYGCGDFSQNWISYLISNNLLTNVLCFGAFTLANGFFKSINLVDEVENGDSALNDNAEHVTEEKNPFPTQILIKNGSELIQVKTLELKYVEVEQNCITIYTKDKRYVLYQSLKSFEQELNPNYFVKIHRSALVNLFFVEKINNLPSGDANLALKTGEILKVSRTYKPILMSKLHEL